MLIKMKESKGFTLVELMIVVAIIGILAAVAVPYYQRYVNKARLNAVVFPGVHAIENALTTRFAVSSTLPAVWDDIYAADASTVYFGVSGWSTSAYGGDAQQQATFTVTIVEGNDKKMAPLVDKTFLAVAGPCSDGTNFTKGTLCWTYSGDLAESMGFK